MHQDRSAAIGGLVVPWTIWLIAELSQPFVSTTRLPRKRLLIPWIWFTWLFVMFFIPGAKQQRYILPIVAPVALLVTQAWYEQHCAAREGRDLTGPHLRHPHWAAMSLCSVLFGPFLML